MRGSPHRSAQEQTIMEYRKPELVLLGNASGLVLMKGIGTGEDGDLSFNSFGLWFPGLDD
jgi:hypothetical protein